MKLFPKSVSHNTPVYRLEEGFDVVGALDAVVGNVGMLKNVQYQKGSGACEVPHIVFVNPGVKERVVCRVVIKDTPADATHRAGCLEILLPSLMATELGFDLIGQLSGCLS